VVPDNEGPQPCRASMDQVNPVSNTGLVSEITEAEVAETIHGFKDTTPGTDHITAGILKELPAFYVKCKEAAITLLPKEGDQGDPSVYRSIALLQVEDKMFTSILIKRLYLAFNNGILSNLQCGFRPGRSTQDCIQALTDAVEDTSRCKEEIHLVYVDMKKAYDSASSERLWHQ